MKPDLLQNQRGAELILVLVFIGIFSAIVGVLINLALINRTASIAQRERELAFRIAEAGINYYRWHLAHDPDDYQDGTAGPGPYIHDYYDTVGNLIGQYQLSITPPPVGSTIATVFSTGISAADPKKRRTIKAQVGVPAFSRYAVVANDDMRFGEGTETFGPIHANGGVRFDGVAHNIITSAQQTYTDPDTGLTQDGVWTSQPNPDTVFLGGTNFPVAPVDFDQITTDIAAMQSEAGANGIYLPPSTGLGYHIVLKPDDTIDMYQVTSYAKCQWRFFFWWIDVADIFSIGNQTSFTYKGSSSLNVPLPPDGLIFAEDDLWVDGSIDTASVTLVAAEEPLATGTASIYINNDLTYTNTNGSDKIGLLAQQDISVAFYSDDDLRIDAALIAQKGRVGRIHYDVPGSTHNPADCDAYVNRNVITLYGSIATNQRYGFAYTDNTGYTTRNINYDTDLSFGPPPWFPTTGEYSVLSWEEL